MAKDYGKGPNGPNYHIITGCHLEKVSKDHQVLMCITLQASAKNGTSCYNSNRPEIYEKYSRFSFRLLMSPITWKSTYQAESF